MNNELEKMNKRRVLMEDGRRHIIFYTFGAENSEEENRKDTKAQRKQEKSEEK